MLPEELYKRRHFGTPQSTLLIIYNYVIFAVLSSIFIACNKVNWFYWVALGLLAVYNFFNIRKDREEYTRLRIIAYVVSVAIMIAMFFLFRSKAQNC